MLKPELSEQTRQQAITVANKVYDLHATNNLYYICNHGTYEIQAVMTMDFYYSLTN